MVRGKNIMAMKLLDLVVPIFFLGCLECSNSQMHNRVW
jgi:hypothetical protein